MNKRTTNHMHPVLMALVIMAVMTVSYVTAAPQSFPPTGYPSVIGKLTAAELMPSESESLPPKILLN